ncbi:MAG: divalent-cation tolerance protein CutA [Candidatus Acidiferrales bacterium]
MTDKIVVMVTCGSQAEAKKIARAVVKARLAACANVLGSPVESIYWGKGKVETAKEMLLLVKSTRKRFSALEREIRRLHRYDTPEIIALPIVEGSRAYLRWIEESRQSANVSRERTLLATRLLFRKSHI